MMRRGIPSAGIVRSYQMDEGWRWFTFNTYLPEGRQNMVTVRCGVALATTVRTVIGLR